MPLWDKIKQLGKRLIIDTAQTNDETAGSQRFRQTVSEAQADPENAAKIYGNAAKQRAIETAAAVAVPAAISNPQVAAHVAVPMLSGAILDQNAKRIGYEGYGDWAYNNLGLSKLMRKSSDGAQNTVKTVLNFTNPGYWIGPGWYKAAASGLKGIAYSADNVFTIGRGLLSGKLKFGDPKTYKVWHQSSEPIETFTKYNGQRWDVTQRGADPRIVWFTDSQVPNAEGLMATRPYASQWTFDSQRPLVQTGELSGLLGKKNNTRNAIVKFGKNHGADAFEFRGIADNKLTNTNVVAMDTKIDPIKLQEIALPNRYKQGGILKAQGGNIITLSPLDQAKRQAYKIVTDPNVWWKGGANLKDVVKNIFRSKPVMEDQNKAEFLFGVKRPETTDGQAYDWENDIKENGYKNVKSYEGTLNPYNEYVLNDRDKGLVEELAKSGYTTSLNINDEYSDPKTGFIDPDTPYFDDVHGYRIRFHNDENGNPVISASDLYDFGKNYSKDFKDLNIERGGNGNLELQRRALNLVGQPYKLVQHNIPIRFTDNPQGSEIHRTNSFTHQVLDKLSDKDIAKITNSGLINPAIISNKQGGIPKHQQGGILSLWKKAYDSKLGNGIRTVLFGQDYNLSDEEYLEKHGFTKPLTGMAPLPTIPESGPFQGIENLAQGNFGTGAVYNAGLQNKLTKIASDRVLKNYNSSVSKWDKFLQRSLRDQDDIVKFWNGEQFKSMKQLEQYPKELNKFKNWILKHQQGGIFDVAYNPYLKQEQQQPTEFIPEIPEPYVPSYTFDKPQEQIVIAPLPEVQETKEPETVEKDSDAVGHFRNFGDSIDFYEGKIYTKAYRDAHGWSIGKGHFLGTEDKWKDYTITKEQAQKMLEQDYKRIKDALDKQIAKHPEKSKIIDDVRYNVLFDLGFNIGTGYYDKIFNDWDGTKEGMASILNKYGRRSLATDPNRKAQEEKALAKRVDARIRAWNA